MQELEKIIDIYLKMDTNYALLITGEWGIGKTYYFKNILQDKIRDVSIYSDNTKKYIPVLVSLFGLKSIDEIQTAILLSIYPFWKKKAVKIGSNISKALLKGYLNLKGLVGFSDVFEEVDLDKEDFIKFQQLVLCFDDLERMSSSLNLEEFIGFINSLVENDNIKILIIANEGKIDKTNYSSLKEKVVGNTIEFIPNVDQVYENILNKNFSGSPSYQNFLQESKDFIKKNFFNYSHNLRTLIFALNYFQSIYSETELHFFTEDFLKDIKGRVLLDLLKFILSISIEYKEGKITYKNSNGVERSKDMFLNKVMNRLWNDNAVPVKENDKITTYADEFVEKYYKEESYNFYKIVYEYITGGTSLNYILLIQELTEVYHIGKNEVLPQYEFYNSLGYIQCYSLSNEDYLSKTKQLLNYAYDGKYNLNLYMTIFFLAMRFNNPLKLNPKKLEKQLIIGMIKGKKLYSYNPVLGQELRLNDNDIYKNELLAIRSATMKLNEEILVESNRSELTDLESLCYSDFATFKNQILSKENSWNYKPLFTIFSPTKFYLFYLNSNNDRKWEINMLFSVKLEWANDVHKPELDFYKKLHIKVSKKNKEYKGVNINGFLWADLEKILQQLIDKLIIK